MKSHKNRGSAIVGVVALTALLTIVVAGFINVVINEGVNEAEAYNEDEAFVSAESGLNLGIRWLRATYPIPAPGDNNTVIIDELINSNYVTVVVNTVIEDGKEVNKINSFAYDKDKCECRKIVRYLLCY